MSHRDPDRLIDEWLRDELDAVPEPRRALTEALGAAAITPQRRGRLFWLRQMLGLEVATVQQGSLDRPEIVLTPTGPSAGGSSVLGRQGAIAMPLAVAVLAVAVVVVAAAAWLTVGPGRELLGSSGPGGLMRPIDGSGPVRVIAVDPVDGHFATLSEAVAEAQPGDRVELYPGTHRAEVFISKDIEIVGVGDRGSIIVEPLPLAEGEQLTDRLRVLFTLADNQATLRGFTLRGSDHGTAVVVDGGSPLLEDLLIDPIGEMSTSGPNEPREALSVDGGASPTIRGGELTSLTGIAGGSTPLFEGVDFRLGCLFIEGEGTSPTVRDSDFAESTCPGFSISVSTGAHVDVVAATVSSPPRSVGIRVANDGSSADITGTIVTGGDQGLLVAPGAAVTFQRSTAQASGIGIKVQDGELVVSDGALVDNGIGLQVGGASFLEVTDTDICNETNFDLRDGALVPPDVTPQNRICVDGAESPAPAAGS